MPTRYLKAGIRDSELIDSLSPLAETFYYRLIVTVDDFGRFDARPAMIKAQCFPIKESVTVKTCSDMLRELANSGLIDIYEVEGKSVLQVCKWDNVPRAKESKYANKPTNVNIPHTNVCKIPASVPLTVTVTETVTVNKTPAQAPVGFDNFWNEYPNTHRKQSKGKCLEVWKKTKVEPDAMVVVNHVARLKASLDWLKNNGEFIPAPLVYLNQRRWDGATENMTQSGILAGAI